MNILFLRGSIPRDRDPQEIVFDTIEEVDDVWTQLVYAMTSPQDKTELWYWGGNRKKKFSENFTERWVSHFKNYTNDFIPDVIFCRGGFPEYHFVLNRFPNAFKIYYGAGRRYLPQSGFNNYDLILQDSPEQLKECQKKYPNIKSSLFIKPAVDTLFKPKDIKKEYDIIFPANGKQEAFKGQKFVFPNLPKNFSLYNLGNKGNVPLPSNATRKRVLKTQMCDELQKGKVGIVCCEASIDSCPRVIPEMIACNIPVVCFDTVRFWRDKYITEQTGVLANKNNIWQKVQYVLDNYDKFTPYEYYKNNLSLKHSATFIKELIR